MVNTLILFGIQSCQSNFKPNAIIVLHRTLEALKNCTFSSIGCIQFNMQITKKQLSARGRMHKSFKYFPLTLCPNLVQCEKSNWMQNHWTTCHLWSARFYTNEISSVRQNVLSIVTLYASVWKLAYAQMAESTYKTLHIKQCFPCNSLLGE